mmetsp:Transcript_4883/g.14792  ORF Transcript_4883/g.14792 Transcript_4883/m.14792 type:complete len:90 (-) Transcript_4883:581-850(-)
MKGRHQKQTMTGLDRASGCALAGVPIGLLLTFSSSTFHPPPSRSNSLNFKTVLVRQDGQDIMRPHGGSEGLGCAPCLGQRRRLESQGKP